VTEVGLDVVAAVWWDGEHSGVEVMVFILNFLSVLLIPVVEFVARQAGDLMAKSILAVMSAGCRGSGAIIVVLFFSRPPRPAIFYLLSALRISQIWLY